MEQFSLRNKVRFTAFFPCKSFETYGNYARQNHVKRNDADQRQSNQHPECRLYVPDSISKEKRAFDKLDIVILFTCNSKSGR